MSVGLRTLVLSNAWMPLSVFPDLYTIPTEEAIDRYFKGKCDVVHWYERPVLTPSRNDLQWPSIIVNHNGNSFKKDVKLKNSTLFYRDHCKCIYCGTDLTLKSGKDNSITREHIIPQSKGGKDTWENVVSCCKTCNHKKGDSLPVGPWKINRVIKKPSFWELINNRKIYPVWVDHEAWVDFLPGWADVRVKNNKNVVELSA